MKIFTPAFWVVVIGAVMLGAGAALPLWVKNGVAVTGWEGDYLSVGRWVLALVGMAVIGLSCIPRVRKSRWVLFLGFMGLIQAFLVLWKGYKLQAIGYGAWVLVAGAVLVLVGAWWMGRPREAAPPGRTLIDDQQG
jgi:peptidoglycan/LPS O-acetylase OafA/YrhL